MPSDKEVDRCKTCLHYFQGRCLLGQSIGKDNCTHYLSIPIEKSPFSTIEKYPTHQSRDIKSRVGKKYAENGGNICDQKVA